MEASKQRSTVLTDWNPEDETKWDKKIAWNTLIITTFSLTIAFCVWFLVSAIAPRLKAIGFDLSKEQLYWLGALPGLSGGLLRLVYMYLPPVVGTRKLVWVTSLLFVIPMFGWGFAVQNTDTPYWWLLCLAFMTGIGGGAFSGYMPSTGYFFPKRLSGTALGLQAGIGNFGMSLVQLLAPWLIGVGLLGITFIPSQKTATGDINLHNIAFVFIPWAIGIAIVAFFMLKDVPVKANFRQQIDIFGNPNTWYMTIIYVMTFGLLSGVGAQFALLSQNTFGEESAFAQMPQFADQLPDPVKVAFILPMLGAIMRAASGPLCDRFGGAIWTFVSGVGMAVTSFVALAFLHPTTPGAFWGFFAVMVAFFFFSGFGNAGTFKQMPMIFNKRQAGGVIGFTSAVASFGPFLVGMILTAVTPFTFFLCTGIYCVICAILTWVFYARPGAPFPG